MYDRKPDLKSKWLAHLDDPRMRAVYVSDALASGSADHVAQVLHVLHHSGALPEQAAKSARDLTLQEVMDILRESGVQLVAIRRPDS